jgi:hypothetical protein
MTRFTSRSLVLLLGLAACKGNSSTALATAQVDTLPGGIIQVTNSGPTAWADTNSWRLVLENTIAPDEESSAALSRPWSLAADNAGNVYVMDMRPNLIKVFRADGSLSHTIGREGDGPDEYRPGAIFHLVGDTLLVHDPANARIVRFKIDGTPLGGWKVEDSRMYARPVRHDGAIPVEINLRDRPMEAGQYFGLHGYRFHRTDGTALDTVRVPAEPKPQMWELRDARNDFGTFVPFAPWQEHVLTPSGTLVWGNTQKYQLIFSRNGDDTTRIVTAPEALVVIPDSVRQSEFDAAVTREAWIAERGKVGDIPTHYPSWIYVAADGTDHIWVQRSVGTTFVADIFTADGILLGAVPTPFEFHPRDHWTATHVYHTSVSESGFPVIQVYRIDRTKP